MPSFSPDLLSAASSLLCPEAADDVACWGPHEEHTEEWAPLPLPGVGRRPVALLLAAEPDHMPLPGYHRSLSPAAAAARLDAVNWILKVNEFYRFRPVTAYLAVNYLDRFLSSNSLPGQNGEQSRGWPMQLLSVACVSVAAKMEETHVPLLLDLQILAPRFVFEPRTIRRMELLLMAALRWRMRSVTPFDFLDPFAGGRSSAAALFSRAAGLILATQRVVCFSAHRPSAIAAAALACAARELTGEISGSCCFDEWVGKDVVEACRQLMEQCLIDACPSAKPASEPPPTPQSPVGVLDAAACGSCDTLSQRSSTPATPQPEPSQAGPPPSKRRRLEEILCTENIMDTGGGADAV